MTRPIDRGTRCIVWLPLLLVLALSGCSPTEVLISQVSVDAPPEAYQSDPSTFSYHRSHLTPQEQYLYDQLLPCLNRQEAEIGDLYPDNDMIQHAIRAIERDHPELFWFSGTGQIETTLMGETPVSAVYQPEYTMEPDERNQIQQTLDTWTADCFSPLTSESSDYDKAFRVYTYLIDHADYAQVDNNSILNIMVDGKGLCGCYAKTAQYLLTQLGMDCTYISGTAGGEVHAWNLVWLDGVPCWMDPTWGDPVFVGGKSSDGPSFDYFCITTDDLQRTHTIDDTVPVPMCNTQTYNYYHRNGLFFESYDPDALTDVLKNAMAAQEPRIHLRFSDVVYASALNQLFDQGQIHDLLRQASQATHVPLTLDQPVWYSRNDDMSSLTMSIPY